MGEPAKNHILVYHGVSIRYDAARRLYMVTNSDGNVEGFRTLQGAIEHIYYGWCGAEVMQW